jgi:hypothetical protein
MGRSQVAFNHRARGRGRGRGVGGRGTGRGERVETASPPSKQPRRPPAAVIHHQQHPPDLHEEYEDYNTLDDRAEQLLSYGTATSTGVAQFQPSSDHDEGEIMFHHPSSTSFKMDVAEQMNHLNRRLALLPIKDRLQLPDFILAEMYHDGGGTTPGTTAKDEEEKASSVVVVAPQIEVETKVDNNDNVKEEEEEENLDDWLDSVIQ